MKKLMLSLLFGIIMLSNVFSQNKSYTVLNNDVEIVKVKSDFLFLDIQSTNITLKKNNYKIANILPFVIDQVPKIPEYILKILSRQKKKYTATYEAKNTLNFNSGSHMPKLVLKKYINHTIANDLAVDIEILPTETINNHFAFYVNKADIKYSSAKIKKKYTHLILLIEITAIYDSGVKNNGTDKTNKTEVKSAALKVPVIVGQAGLINSSIKRNLSDGFPIQNIMEISVKVTEVNPFKVKLEEIESFTEDFKEPIAEFFTKLGESLK